MSEGQPDSICIVIVFNGRDLEVPVGTTVRDLVTRLNLPERGIAIEIDEHIIARSRWDETRLGHGARVELVQMVGGG